MATASPWNVSAARTVMLPHLLVGVVGGFQPDLLARSFAGDGDGIYARFICVAARGAPFREPADDVDETDPEIAINAFGRLARPAGR